MIWLAKNWRIALFGAVSLALAIAISWGLWQRSRIASLEAERARLSSVVSSYKEAAKIRRADDLRRSEISDQADQFSHDMDKEEGGDAILDPYLASGARKLWP